MYTYHQNGSVNINVEVALWHFGVDAADAGNVHSGAGGKAGGQRRCGDNSLGAGQQG